MNIFAALLIPVKSTEIFKLKNFRLYSTFVSSGLIKLLLDICISPDRDKGHDFGIWPQLTGGSFTHVFRFTKVKHA